MLRKETVENFIKKLESKEPVPGGGSAAALAGGLATALALMVINIVLSKVNPVRNFSGPSPRPAATERERGGRSGFGHASGALNPAGIILKSNSAAEQRGIISNGVNSRKTRDYLRQAKKNLNSLKKSLILLVDKDAEAYGKVAGAFKLPKNTEAETEKRREKIQECYKIAAIIPLKSAVLSFQAKGIIKNIKNLIPGNLVSDIEVAGFLAEAALKGAIANVRINLPGIKDKKFKEKANLALRRITRLTPLEFQTRIWN